MYLRFFLLYLIDFAFSLIGYATNWLWPLFADKRGNLPYCFRWFQTYDDTLDGSEIRFILGTMKLRNEDRLPKNRFCRYLLRVMWLYRNNTYTFAYSVLGAPGPFMILSESGTMPQDRYPAKEGKHLRIFQGSDGRRYFQFKYVKARANGKCYEASIGWKYNTGERAMLAMRWTPFRKFETSPVT